MIDNLDRTDLLINLLRYVSRSFYLTLRILPNRIREPISIAYLLARAADTVADTLDLSINYRIKFLDTLTKSLKQINEQDYPSYEFDNIPRVQSNSYEYHLLLSSMNPIFILLRAQTFQDRVAIQKVLTTLISGIEFDIKTFPNIYSSGITSIRTSEELDKYIYLVAGCVGEFWTEMVATHTRAARYWHFRDMQEKGIRFGKALQMTNILRDCAKDLHIGRCYLPKNILDAYGLSIDMLLTKDASKLARPVLYHLLSATLKQYRDACEYILAIPRRFIRLRLACLFPILIGIETLELLARNSDWLDSERSSKVSRFRIYRILINSFKIVSSNFAIRSCISESRVSIMKECYKRL
ncbi:MAG: phytoene/squalene synthase family protein [Burkholderia sp.]|nr:phytoene/squalene synthase family protein [Burkholderia sp.]